MFEQLNSLPADPLLGLIEKVRNDSRAEKVDLGVGIYKNGEGLTPVLDCVKVAEQTILASEDSKAYVGPSGNAIFNTAMRKLVFGEHSNTLGDRLVGFQMPGGCGALRVLAETLVISKPACTVWVSDPTWVNHVPLLCSAGIELKTYPYYDFEHSSLRFADMLQSLEQASGGDVVLLHGCCHNPSGADLSKQQWDQVVELCQRKALVPFIDMAYQGFGDGIDDDAYGVRLAASKLPELLVAVSCSKNFGLYRERVGAAFVLAEHQSVAAKVDSHMKSITRGMYSMPPSHGASIVATILSSQSATQNWTHELHDMRSRISSLRVQLSEGLRNATGSSRFDFIEHQKGMFSFLGIDQAQVSALARDYGIYMADSSRINLAGLNANNMAYCVDALAQSSLA